PGHPRHAEVEQDHEAFDRQVTGAQHPERLDAVAGDGDRSDLGCLTECAMDVHHVQVVIFHQQEMDPLLLHDWNAMLTLFSFPWMRDDRGPPRRRRRWGRRMAVRSVG